MVDTLVTVPLWSNYPREMKVTLFHEIWLSLK